MKVALIIGHNERSRGAFSSLLGSEYDYWKRIAEKVKQGIPDLVDVYERKPSKNYVAEMNEVLRDVNSKNYKYCLELHFNSALNKQANGCECLIYWKNEQSKELATQFMARLQSKFGSKIRIKENTIVTTKENEKGQEEKKEEKVRTHGLILVRDSNTRGGYGICKSRHTYLLLEPFFGSNEEESLKFSNEDKVVDLFVKYIKEVQV